MLDPLLLGPPYNNKASWIMLAPELMNVPESSAWVAVRIKWYASDGNIVWKSFLLFSHSVVSNSLRPCGLQHARLSCPSLSPKVCSNSCPLSWWCHPTISSSVTLSFSCLQSFPASGSFPMSQLFASGGQSIGASTSFLLINIQEILISFRIDWFDLLAVQGTLKSLLQHHNSKASVLQCSALFMAQILHLHMTTGKTIALITWTYVSKVISLLFNTLSMFVIAFLPSSKTSVF